MVVYGSNTVVSEQICCVGWGPEKMFQHYTSVKHIIYTVVQYLPVGSSYLLQMAKLMYVSQEGSIISEDPDSEATALVKRCCLMVFVVMIIRIGVQL